VFPFGYFWLSLNPHLLSFSFRVDGWRRGFLFFGFPVALMYGPSFFHMPRLLHGRLFAILSAASFFPRSYLITPALTFPFFRLMAD